MSKKGGGSISGGVVGGGAASGFSGGGAANGSRNSHFKMVQSDSKYGMLLWQSKLQEKMLKEQKEKRETARRKSGEDSKMNSRGNSGSGGGGRAGSSTSNSNDNKNHRPGSRQHRGERHVEILMDKILLAPTITSAPVTPASDQPPPNLTQITTPTFVVSDTSANFAADQMGTLRNYYRDTATRPAAGLSNNYQRDQPMFPKLVTKLSSSVSCDNLAKNAQQTFGNIGFWRTENSGPRVGGGGAPRRTPSGRLMTNLQGHADIRYHQKDTRNFDQTLRYMMDKEKIVQYKEDLDRQLEEKRKWRKQQQLGSPTSGAVGTIKIMSSHDQLETRLEEPYYSAETGRRVSRNGMELAPLIRKYKSLPKLNTLSSTDVTKPFNTSPRRVDNNYGLNSPEPEEIAKGLSLQCAEKHKIQQLNQENEKLAAERHFNTWDSFWGRPGHGAPMFHSRNSPIGASTSNLSTSRVDLFRALHLTHQQNKSK